MPLIPAILGAFVVRDALKLADAAGASAIEAGQDAAVTTINSINALAQAVQQALLLLLALVLFVWWVR